MNLLLRVGELLLGFGQRLLHLAAAGDARLFLPNTLRERGQLYFSLFQGGLCPNAPLVRRAVGPQGGNPLRQLLLLGGSLSVAFRRVGAFSRHFLCRGAVGAIRLFQLCFRRRLRRFMRGGGVAGGAAHRTGRAIGKRVRQNARLLVQKCLV